MGIKFLCDRCGKKLNVKSFLAGKRGICPKCGAKVDIPGDPAESLDKAGYSGVDPPKTSPGYSTGPTPAQPLAASTAQVAYSAAPVATAVGAPAVLPSAAPAGVQGVGLATSPGTVDPIASAPNAMWYVRPTSGGQYGPANGELLRHWIDQGRVGADSLVWREGWADWQQASLLFPQMGAPAAAPTAAPTSPALAISTQPTSSLALSTEPRSGGYRQSHRRSNSMSITIMVVLSFVAIALIAGLIYVLSR